jgi:1,4-alpha-glucan branching enzyme
VRTVNALVAEHPELWERDFDADGFRWIDANDADQNVLSFLRFGAGTSPQRSMVACVANLSPVVRAGYRLGVPQGGTWIEILNTDAPLFGGSGVVNGALVASAVEWHGLPAYLELTLPPLAVVWLAPEV